MRVATWIGALGAVAMATVCLGLVLRVKEQDRLLHSLESRTAANEAKPRVVYQVSSLSLPTTRTMRETTRATPPLQEVPAVSEEHSEEESTENPSGTASAQDDDPKERAVAQTARFNAVLDTFHAQPVDRAWSSRTSARIEGLLGPRLAKVPHGDVECRSTWCSLELTPPAGTDNRAVLQTVMFASSELEDKPRLMMYACPRDDGTLAYRYYFGYERH